MGDSHYDEYDYLLGFTKMVEDPSTISILLNIAKNKRSKISELHRDLGIDTYDLIEKLKFLETNGFIEQNPHPKDLDKTYRLAFDGQLFAEQLKRGFPNVKAYLGEENLIQLN